MIHPQLLAVIAEAAFTAHYIAMRKPPSNTKAGAALLWRESSQARDLWTGICVAVLDAGDPGRAPASSPLPGLGAPLASRLEYGGKAPQARAFLPQGLPDCRPTPPGLAVEPDAALPDGRLVEFKTAPRSPLVDVDMARVEAAYAADPRPDGSDPEALRAWKNRWFGYHYGRPLRPTPVSGGKVNTEQLMNFGAQIIAARIDRQKLAHTFLDLGVEGPFGDNIEISGITRKAFREAAERNGLSAERIAQFTEFLPEA